MDERINSGGDLRSRLGGRGRRGSEGRRQRGSGDGDSLEREDLEEGAKVQTSTNSGPARE